MIRQGSPQSEGSREKTASSGLVRLRTVATAALGSLCLLLISTCGVASLTAHRQRTADDGVLDLRTWSPEREGSVKLDGEWHFSWGTLVQPADSVGPTTGGTISVPGSWRGWKIDGRPLEAYGYASHRLTVLMPPEPGSLFIHVPVVSSAFRFFVNGALVTSRGQVGRSLSAEAPEWRPTVEPLPPVEGVLEILVLVSNFHHNRGGLIRSIELADARHAPFFREAHVALDLFLTGALLIMGVYHLAFFALRRNDPAPLYFGLFCFAIAVRTLATGDEVYLLRILPNLRWEMLQKVLALSFAAAIPLFSAFVRSLFPSVYPRWALWSIAALASLMSLIAITFPAHVHTWFDLPYQIATILACIVVMHVLLISLRKRLPGAAVFLGGFVVLFATTINDILYGNGIIGSVDLVGVGLLIFVLAEAFLISRRTAAAILTVETQSRELAAVNRAYEAERDRSTRAEQQRLFMEQEAREQQRRLVESNRLSSLGVLVAGVAHEVNNPNHAVLLNAQFLVHAVPELVTALDQCMEGERDVRIAGMAYRELRERLPEIAGTIKLGSERIAAIVSELKSYARDDSERALGRVDINCVVSAAVSLAGYLLKTCTDYPRVKLAPRLPAVMGSRQRLEQVVLNLLQNACQALRARSETIEVRTEYNARTCEVVVTVRDQGRGMDDQTLARITNPFFTTKRELGGTGLGLSVSSSIVKQHQGSLVFRSTFGKGTEAIVRLPATADE